MAHIIEGIFFLAAITSSPRLFDNALPAPDDTPVLRQRITQRLTWIKLGRLDGSNMAVPDEAVSRGI